ncbi:hypothetical protein [Dictyobacter formicarum]|uniref:hypothetical protein n=1 Tax=Dictyobacter formicarum TaxID=2778368 RepID=UPI001916A017|nr:hypothetical protein [Dictyobacter formicarum]
MYQYTTLLYHLPFSDWRTYAIPSGMRNTNDQCCRIFLELAAGSRLPMFDPGAACQQALLVSIGWF